MKNKLQLPKVSMIEDDEKSEIMNALEKVINSKVLTFTPMFEDDIEAIEGNIIPIPIDEKISVRCIKDLKK